MSKNYYPVYEQLGNSSQEEVFLAYNPFYQLEEQEEFEEEKYLYSGEDLIGFSDGPRISEYIYEENNSSEEELNEISWERQEIRDVEREENIGEWWISSDPIIIDGMYAQETNREQIMDILSGVVPAKGLSEEARARITEFLYNDEISDENCVICCEKFEEKNVLLKLPCSHIFHKDCFLEYAERSDNCPLDRKKI
ncbi:unnamed protein product [Blepharisma stoltei]|uniref:RING-type domain-containing protein n=1 Tax=Blepharisma stoltei TaxID=1481888 RepID=A0AAU9JXC4_9CILI|nr:unnamed protein product [Blepharisma stoltei]